MADGIRKSAVLLMSLGEEHAASVLKLLPQSAVQALGEAMATLSHVKRNEVSEVLEEFHIETEQYSALHLGSGSYLRAVLNNALGTDRAADVLDTIFQADESASGIDRLNQLEATEVVELIRDEHPQIITTLLVHMDRGKAADVLAQLPERVRHDAILRVATFGGVQPAALKELTEVLGDMLGGQGVKRSRLGGVRAAAEIVNMMGSAQEESVIKHVREHDEVLAQKMIDEMFLFENLLDLEDRGIQLLLKEVESESLTIALKGAPPELLEKFLKNMSNRAAEMLREDIEVRGPVRVSQVEAEQKSILLIVRRLADSGEIVLGGQGNDAYV
ncbi:flagellar motor switch protein FliG [Rhodoferax sp.]|uniref:flagellar motor switch protein FliG n=1 Tax=Rhodoferax sp. TaxID=50421 RepID=UPI002730BEE2|nr:flagellar motor switch protein FliG [Rhodoferax sp.]MDP1530418.1 flagellar motor switch protein FliG [Rhodoferax sp.]MDP1943236.1 flagellar motor switch protein FliG [Rhodoferax sp.]MDP2442720.1 flagellar motor switch protein FliG [Rhodoferax sp.]MDZ4206366.1 flagellar motor switch protein FliG [Rhodoferax sp.]